MEGEAIVRRRQEDSDLNELTKSMGIRELKETDHHAIVKSPDDSQVTDNKESQG